MSDNKRNFNWMPLPKNEEELRDHFLKGRRHPAMKMADIAMKMKRSPNQAFVLLVGLSGAGKSSTVNYLFETNIAQTSSTRSETKSTIEYTVTMDSEEWKIPALKLSFVDTPGFGDTDGLYQDAKNILSIKNFVRDHPNLQNYFPNLVMIGLNIMDNRIEGESSNFAKMLKGIKEVNAVDPNNPNVVVVLTHVCAIARNAKIWKEKVEKKKAEVRAIVRVHLGVDPEVTVQENKPEDMDLQKESDWHILPNGEKQPKILFHACKQVLNGVKDEIGHEAISVCFRPGSNKTVTVGRISESSEVELQDAQDMKSCLLQGVIMVSESEIGKMLEDYKKEKNVVSLHNDILILQVRLRDLAISTAKDLQSMSINTLITKMYPTRITVEMQSILEEVFGLSYEQMSGYDFHIGKGYNIFSDSTTTASPLVLKTSKVGMGLPENVNLRDCSSCEIQCRSVDDNDQYIKERLRQLNVSAGVAIKYSAFNMEMRAGFNSRCTGNLRHMSSVNKSSFSVEHRVRKVALQSPFILNEEFKTDISLLPNNYDLKNEDNILKWTAFIEKWGCYVVTEAFIGGSLTGDVKVESDHSEDFNFDDTQAALAMRISFLQSSGDFDSAKRDENVTLNVKSTKLHSTSLKWEGGNRDLYKISLDNISRSSWTGWVKSLEHSPAPLRSSMKLYPLHHLVTEQNRQKGTELHKAMNLALKGEFNYEPPAEDNRETAATSNDSGSCFHEDSAVMLRHGQRKKLKDLRPGEKILTLDQYGVIKEDEMITWLHRVEKGQYKFLEVYHDSGRIKMTHEHIIFVGKEKTPCKAAGLKPGDVINYIDCQGGNLTPTLVTVFSIKEEEGVGLYAPLTYTGRLIVDGVAVSCYCKLQSLQIRGIEMVSSHRLAHFGFLPLRMAYLFGMNINDGKIDEESGIHVYAKWLIKKILT